MRCPVIDVRFRLDKSVRQVAINLASSICALALAHDKPFTELVPKRMRG